MALYRHADSQHHRAWPTLSLAVLRIRRSRLVLYRADLVRFSFQSRYFRADRSVSLHERYAHVTVITRDVHTITYLYQYPSTLHPSVEYLHGRVAEVQNRVHHLWSEVTDGETRTPCLRLRPKGPWASGQVVGEAEYEARIGVIGEAALVEVEAKLLEQEIARMRARAADGGPLWQVTRYFPNSADGQVNSTTTNPTTTSAAELPCYIAVSAYHHLIDGTGGLRLSLALLIPDYPILHAPGLAPRLEDVVPIAPSLPFLLVEAYKEFIDPILPSFLRRTTCWPGEKANGIPNHSPEAQVSIHLPASWIGKLKRAGKANGVTTLHPALEAAFVMALHEVTSRPDMSFDIVSPVNERDASIPDHPEIGGDIFTVVRKTYASSDFPTSPILSEKGDTDDTPFWSLAQSTASHHSSPSARSQGRYMVGMLAYVPDSKNFSSPHAEDPKRRTKTGWEQFFWENVERPSPYRTSVAFSNLGRIHTLPPGCTGMRWAQSAAPFEDAMLACLIGHDEGMEVSVAFRDGCAISRAEVRELLALFKDILRGLVEA